MYYMQSDEYDDDDDDTGHGGIQLKSYVQKEITVSQYKVHGSILLITTQVNDTPERHTSSRPDTYKVCITEYYCLVMILLIRLVLQSSMLLHRPTALHQRALLSHQIHKIF